MNLNFSNLATFVIFAKIFNLNIFAKILSTKITQSRGAEESGDAGILVESSKRLVDIPFQGLGLVNGFEICDIIDCARPLIRGLNFPGVFIQFG